MTALCFRRLRRRTVGLFSQNESVTPPKPLAALAGIVTVVLFVACAKGSGQSNAGRGQDPGDVQGHPVAPPDRVQGHYPGPQGTKGEGVPDIWVRPGYKVELVADGLENARFMQFGPDGTLYLARPSNGDILSMRLGKDGKYAKLDTFVDGMPTVHGMCWHGDWLWFTRSGSIYKAQDDGNGKAKNLTTVIPEGKLPSGGHWWRSILVTDQFFFTSIGDAGNIEDHTKDDRSKVWRYSLDGKTRHMFSSGIRNTEKLLFRPGTDELWGADQGSDWFGAKYGDKEGRQPITDQNPCDKFYHYEDGGFYGHPFIVGDRIPRPEYADRPDIIDLAERTIPPTWQFGPRWAADGWIFLTGSKAFPADHEGDAFVGFHGSWNRRQPAGYCVERILFDKVTGLPYGSQTIVRTRGPKGEILGRPVDVTQAPDGSLLFSDDYTNRIYRLSSIAGK